MKFKVFLFVFVLILNSNFLFANKLISNVFSDTSKDFYVIIVDKTEKKAYVVHQIGNSPTIVKKFHVLIGEHNGDKTKKGDKKTPEGVYHITGYIPPTRLLPKYGAGAFPINYPNIVDKKIFHKTGGGIWLHGVNENENKKATKGCVAFHNGDFQILKKFVKRDTPVIITKNVSFLKDYDYFYKRKEYLSLLNNFIKSWEKGDFQKFKNYISKKFVNNKNLKYNMYLKIKKMVMDKFKYRKILVDNIKIYVENNQEFVYQFHQVYCATNVISVGEKTLYFQSEKNTPKIIAEVYKEKDFNEYVTVEIAKFLEKWRKLWINKDRKFLSFYDSKKFTDFENFKKRKLETFRKYKNINVRIESFTIKMISPILYEVKFRQYYSADGYSDIGIKKILLRGCPGDFKIVSERWQKI